MLNKLRDKIFTNNVEAGWWNGTDITNCRTHTDNNKHTKEGAMLIASKLCLVHSEVSEALEGMRKGLKDDHLPHRPMLEVELADALIRILDLCGACELDIAGAVEEKLEYNSKRADHKLANRAASGGKTI